MNECDAAPAVLVCGLLAADIVFNTDTIPTEAIKHRAKSASLICGGGGCYAALAINRLGGKPSLLARLGDDDFGKFVLSALHAENIDCKNVGADAQSQTPISSVVIDKHGERQIVNYRSQDPIAPEEDLYFDAPPRAVLVDGRWKEGSKHALDYAKAHNIPGVLDAEAPVSLETLTLASHIAFSRQGLSEFTSTDSIPDGLQKAAALASASGWVCVTDGENGTHLLSGNKLVTIPAPKIKAVDTLGAGDVWHGAFALQLAKGADEYNAAQFANVAAALKCSRHGGGMAAPNLAEVNEFINSNDE